MGWQNQKDKFKIANGIENHGVHLKMTAAYRKRSCQASSRCKITTYLALPHCIYRDPESLHSPCPLDVLRNKRHLQISNFASIGMRSNH